MKHIKLFEDYISNKFDFETNEELLDYIINICSIMNIEYDYIKLLAEGGNGLAIDLGNSILKITFDFSEVYFAYMLLNVDSPNLIKIYDIKKTNLYYIIHEEKLFTNLNNTIFTFLYYLHRRNHITNNIENASDNEVLDYFKDKLHLSKENILILFNMYKRVYLEAKKYNIDLTDFHEKNVGIRKSNPNELVYFDISNPYDSYKEIVNNLNIENISIL